jgi:hypothetical protein
MVTASFPIGVRASDERGFSLVELMIVGLITTMIAGAAVTLAGQVQRTYSYQLNDAAVQQEARYAMDWMTRILVAAGNNPYGITTSNCPAAGTVFVPLTLDPDGDGIQDDVRVRSDINRPNGILLGLAGACNEVGEDVTIAHDAVNLTLTRFDRALENAAVAVTDQVFTRLRFTYLDVNRAVTVVPANIVYAQVNLTGRSKSRNPYTGQFTTFTYQSEVRVRAR